MSLDRLLAHQVSELRICQHIHYELLVGLEKSALADAPELFAKKQRRLDDLLAYLDVIPFTAEAAHEAARVRALLESKGMKIGPIDTLIAGTARCHGFTLVSENLSEFSRVDGLVVENWSMPPDI
ncbi:tRNA(fMet)-specific endonuclease VapC [Haloferula sargassicola]|uniref:tRNA(fMet)-specific endonuclease VapC n=2 Tax=Haloferula sargassicola TaxID=490096 RepID=A0ABP9UMA8_9BACT